jgi:hypothetical protein
MSKKRLLFTVGLTLIFSMATLLVSQGTIDAQKCRIIRIHQEKGSAGTTVRVEPQSLHISKDTCVIWINWVPKEEVRVIFREDGKSCQDATDSPMGFSMAENCYVTNFIPLGGTSSLKFNEEGTFRYEVEVPGETKGTGQLALGHGEVKGKGEIVVR